jgi:hypothetical protein
MRVLQRRSAWGRVVKRVSELRLPRRRSAPGRLVKQAASSRPAKQVGRARRAAPTPRLPELHPSKAVKSGLAASGGLIGLTAGSAAVSAARRRSEESRSQS